MSEQANKPKVSDGMRIALETLESLREEFVGHILQFGDGDIDAVDYITNALAAIAASRAATDSGSETLPARDQSDVQGFEAKPEKILVECHMALLGISPASYAWGNVNEWLVHNGKSDYARKLKSVIPPKQNEFTR